MFVSAGNRFLYGESHWPTWARLDALEQGVKLHTSKFYVRLTKTQIAQISKWVRSVKRSHKCYNNFNLCLQPMIENFYTGQQFSVSILTHEEGKALVESVRKLGHSSTDHKVK